MTVGELWDGLALRHGWGCSGSGQKLSQLAHDSRSRTCKIECCRHHSGKARIAERPLRTIRKRVDVVDIVSGFKFCKRRFCMAARVNIRISAPKMKQIPTVSAPNLSELGGI